MKTQGVVVWPLHDLVLIQVIAESQESPGGILLSDQERSLQGTVVRSGPLCREDLNGARVIFDDNACQWWRGEDPSYVQVLVADEDDDEYVLVPESQIFGTLPKLEEAI